MNRNLYVDEPRLDMIQWVTRAFTTSVRKSLDTAFLLYLASNYTEAELSKLPVSAISHLVDVRFIRDVDGGIEPKILLSRNPNVIRKLTPREFWRLQGFTDQQFDTCAKIQSNAQLYKQAGNSVSIPIVYELGKNIIEHHRRLHGNE